MKRVVLPAIIYCILVFVIGYPIFSQPQSQTLGWLGTDAIDTMSLRHLFFHSGARFQPFGYDFGQLTPNIFDHLSALPFLLIFSFPLSDNLWWFVILWLNGLAAHRLGQRLGNEATGYWSGILVLSSEQLLREVNLHHAPQSMVFFPLLFCCSLSHKEKTSRNMVWSGIFLGLSGLCYFFFVPFLMLATMPILLTLPKKKLLILLFVSVIILSPNLVWLFTTSHNMLHTPKMGQIMGTTMQNLHSTSVDFFAKTGHFDLSNEVSVVALFLSCWAIFTKKKYRLLWPIVVGSMLVMGRHFFLFPLLEKIPLLSRMVWPERWGLLILLGLIFASISALRTFSTKKTLSISLLLVIEMWFRSGNLPLHSEPIASYQCYEELKNINGTVLELPLANNDRLFNRSALYQRLHQRPMINHFLLPPTANPPKDWEKWKDSQWLRYLDQDSAVRSFSQTILLQELKNHNISAIIIDQTDFSPLSQIEQESRKRHLSAIFGKAIDVGCFSMWSLQPFIPQQKWKPSPHPKNEKPLLMEVINAK